jgi:hypothetical protein
MESPLNNIWKFIYYFQENTMHLYYNDKEINNLEHIFVFLKNEAHKHMQNLRFSQWWCKQYCFLGWISCNSANSYPSFEGTSCCCQYPEDGYSSFLQNLGMYLQTTWCYIPEHTNLHINTFGMYNADLFEVTADCIHHYDCMKRFSNITLSVTQLSVKPGTNV